MEDMLNGLNEWRNIQTVVRQTFKAMHDVIQNQVRCGAGVAFGRRYAIFAAKLKEDLLTRLFWI